MDGFDLLKQASEVSDRVEKAREYVRGGPLTDMLEAIGDLHLRSAIEHLNQAAVSSAPRERLLQGAAEMQTAFFAFDRAVASGTRGLRILLDPASLAASHAQAAGCAATSALIQWVVSESPTNRRYWLDRTAQHVAQHCRDVRDRRRNVITGKSSFGPGWETISLNEKISSYFMLERNILPAEHVRPKPIGWWTLKELIEKGLSVPPHEQYTDAVWLPRYDVG